MKKKKTVQIERYRKEDPLIDCIARWKVAIRFKLQVTIIDDQSWEEIKTNLMERSGGNQKIIKQDTIRTLKKTERCNENGEI